VRQHFDLSQNKSLRTLETTALSMTAKGSDRDFLTTVLSPLHPPALDVVIVYESLVLVASQLACQKTVLLMGPNERRAEMPCVTRTIRAVRRMYRVWKFGWWFVDVSNWVEGMRCEPWEAVSWRKRRGGLDYLHRELLIIRGAHTLSKIGIQLIATYFHYLCLSELYGFLFFGELRAFGGRK